MRMPEWIRGHVATIIAAIIVIVAVTYAGYIEHTRDAERDERRAQVNALACAFDAYYAKVGEVTGVRGLPGDEILNAAAADVRKAAAEVGGPCPK